MRLRTFTADDMTDAMEQIRVTLGHDAVIISTTQDGNNGVTVTAACDNDNEDDVLDEENVAWFDSLHGSEASFGKEEITTPYVAPVIERTSHLHQLVAPSAQTPPPASIPEDIAHALQHLFLSHGVSDYVVESLLQRLSTAGTPPELTLSGHHNPLEHWVKHVFNVNFTMKPLKIINDSCRHILIGAPGAGKTMTTAKIAATMVKANKKIHIISTDNKRAGGVEQLAAITDILGIDLQIADTRQTLKLMLSDIPLNESVIVDSAGANPYDFYELKELGEFAGLIELDPVLVYPAGSDPHEADEVARAFSFLGVEKIIVTRIDAARRFGGMLNAAHAAGLQFCNVTGSEKILGTFEECTSQKLTELYMGYQP